MLAQEGSLLGLVARCAGGERRLAPIDVSGAPSDELSRTVGQIADPERPIETPEFFGDMFGGRRDNKPVSRVVKLPAAATPVLALVPLWRYPPLDGLTGPATVNVPLDTPG